MTPARSHPVARRAPLAVLAGVFLASYLSWRPSSDLMFTISDALFLTGGIAMAVRGQTPLRPMGPLTPLWIVSFVAMTGGLLIGSMTGGDPLRWPIVAGQYLFAWLLLPCVLMGHDRRYTLSLAVALLAGVVAMELVGILVYAFYDASYQEMRSVLGQDFISGNRRLGVFATDANWNGAVIALTLPYVYFLASRRSISRPVAMVASAILLIALLVTASFTAFSSMVLATLMFVATGVVRPRWWMVATVAVLGVVLLQSGVEMPDVFRKRVGDAIVSGDINEAGTFGGRVELMADAWQRAGDHLLLGLGVDQDRVVSKLHAPVHNMYLLIWVEGGLPALAGWIGMLLTFFATALRAFRRDRLASALALSVLTTFLIFSSASPHMYARLWAVPVLIALAIARHGAEGPGAMRHASPSGRAALGLRAAGRGGS
jgi:O-antigen ligase